MSLLPRISYIDFNWKLQGKLCKTRDRATANFFFYRYLPITLQRSSTMSSTTVVDLVLITRSVPPCTHNRVQYSTAVQIYNCTLQFSTMLYNSLILICTTPVVKCTVVQCCTVVQYCCTGPVPNNIELQ